MEVYCIHKTTAFGFPDVDHTCPGWRECGELTEMWRKLDRVDFQFKGMVPEFKIRLVAILLLCSSGSFCHNPGYSCELENVTANTLIPVIVSPFVQP